MMMTDTKRNANSEGMILSEMGPYDVLLGRGTGPNNNLGNLRYREVVKSTMAKYAAAAPHPNNNNIGEDSDDDVDVTPVVPVVKGQIVNEILDAVRLLGGRFVRKLTKEEMKMVLDRHNNNSNKPNHHSGGSSKTKKTMTTSSSSSKKFNKLDLFVIVTNRMAAEKTKQSIRFQLNKKQNKNSSGTTFTNRGNSSMAAKIIAAKARFERNKKTTTTVPRQEDEEDDLKVSATASSKKKADVQDAWSPQQATARGGNSLQALHGHAASRSSTRSSLSTKVNAPGLLNETASTRLVETRSSPMMVTRDPYLGGLGPSPFLLNSNTNLLHRLGLVTSPPGLSSSITSSGLGLDPAAAVVADSLYGVPRMPAPPLSLSLSSWLCGGRAATNRQHPLLSRTTQQILQDALIIAESEARVRSSAEARVAATAAAAIESLRRHHLLN